MRHQGNDVKSWNFSGRNGENAGKKNRAQMRGRPDDWGPAATQESSCGERAKRAADMIGVLARSKPQVRNTGCDRTTEQRVRQNNGTAGTTEQRNLSLTRRRGGRGENSKTRNEKTTTCCIVVLRVLRASAPPREIMGCCCFAGAAGAADSSGTALAGERSFRELRSLRMTRGAFRSTVRRSVVRPSPIAHRPHLSPPRPPLRPSPAPTSFAS